MMRRRSLLFAGALICTLACLTAYNAVGQEKNGDVDEKKAAGDAQAADNVSLAHTLISYGRQHKSPEALVSAALILHKNPAKKFKDIEGGEEIKEDTPQDLLKEAGEMRPKDKALADYIAKAADDVKEEARGSIGFPIVGARSLSGKSSITIRHGFKGKQFAFVKVLSLPHPDFIKVFGVRIPILDIDSVNVRITEYPFPAKGKVYYNATNKRLHVATFTPAKTGLVAITITNPHADKTVVSVVSN